MRRHRVRAVPPGVGAHRSSRMGVCHVRDRCRRWGVGAGRPGGRRAVPRRRLRRDRRVAARAGGAHGKGTGATSTSTCATRPPAAAAAAGFGDVTHVVYTAVYELPGPRARLERAGADGHQPGDAAQPDGSAGGGRDRPRSTSACCRAPRRTACTSTRSPIPARERFPRDQHENFYWLQEDYIRDKSAAEGWAFSIWRPQLIVGPNHGVVMNLPPIIGAFAAICREEGRPFGFPGGASWVWECVDTRLVADALAWGATSPNAVGETFNLTNGEVFEWRTLWPSFAETFGARGRRPTSRCRSPTLLPAKADLWDRIVAKHGLRPIKMADLVGESHHYADFCFALGATEAPPAGVRQHDQDQAGRLLRRLGHRGVVPLLAPGPHRPQGRARSVTLRSGQDPVALTLSAYASRALGVPA